MTYDQWKTTEPEQEPIWLEKGYKNKHEYCEAVALGVEEEKGEIT